jgi:hypothetical protein
MLVDVILMICGLRTLHRLKLSKSIARNMVNRMWLKLEELFYLK